MSLRLQINLLIAALLALFIAILGQQRLADARSSVREEIETANRVATALLARLARAHEQAGVAGMEEFLSQLGRVRAHDLYLYDHAGHLLYASPPSPYKAGRAAPAWFAGLVAPGPRELEIPLADGRLRVVANDSRAVLDGWDDFQRLAVTAGLGFLLINALVFWLTGRALRPLAQVVAGLERMGDGDLAYRLPALAGREAQVIGEAFNRMAQAVAETAAARQSAAEARQRLAENRDLTRIIQARIEDERRAIARELHDELGQSITAVKSLGLSIALSGGDEQAARAATVIVETAGRMYDAVHDLIPRLRPVALDALGLADALAELVADCRSRQPAGELLLEIGALPEGLGDALATGAYRIVQEAVNNAQRHADARRIAVRVAVEGGQLLVSIEDDGRGLPADWQAKGHYGLRGMQERAAALGGECQLDPARGGGLRVTARLPLSARP